MAVLDAGAAHHHHVGGFGGADQVDAGEFFGHFAVGQHEAARAGIHGAHVGRGGHGGGQDFRRRDVDAGPRQRFGQHAAGARGGVGEKTHRQAECAQFMNGFDCARQCTPGHGQHAVDVDEEGFAMCHARYDSQTASGTS